MVATETAIACLTHRLRNRSDRVAIKMVRSGNGGLGAVLDVENVTRLVAGGQVGLNQLAAAGVGAPEAGSPPRAVNEHAKPLEG